MIQPSQSTIGEIPRSPAPRVILLALAILGSTVACLLSLTDIIGAYPSWYSQDVAYRCQVEALLAGRLAISETPIGHNLDWAWGPRGIQQVWGLGVPFLRLPFELAARAVGFGHFPDRVLLVGFQTVAGTFLAVQLFLALRTFDRRPWFLYLMSLSAGTTAVLSPAILALFRSRFIVYEEAVAFHCLWAVLILAAYIGTVARHSRGSYLFLSFLCGTASLFRLDGFCYGLATLLLASYYNFVHRRFRLMAFGVVIALSGLSLHLALNVLRFGSALNFGYEMQLTGLQEMNYANRFGFPFLDEAIWRRLLETIGSLFLLKNLNGLGWYARDVMWFQARTTRFREFSFAPFSLLDLGCLIVLICIGLASLRAKHRYRHPLPSWLAAWALTNFSLLVAFYAHTPAIADRHLVNLSPAMSAAIVSLALFSAVHSGRRRWLGGIVPAIYWIANLKLVTLSSPETAVPPTSSEGLSCHHLIHNDRVSPPRRYKCGVEPEVDVPENLTGWRVTTDCAVDNGTTLFFSKARCVALVAVPRLVHGLSLVEVKFMDRLGIVDGLVQLPGALVRCDPAPERQPDWLMVTVKWRSVGALYRGGPWIALFEAFTVDPAVAAEQ